MSRFYLAQEPIQRERGGEGRGGGGAVPKDRFQSIRGGGGGRGACLCEEEEEVCVCAYLKIFFRAYECAREDSASSAKDESLAEA